MSEEINKTILECPKCHKKWCEITWAFDRPITYKDIRVLDGDKTFKEDEPLTCNQCGFEYRECDVMLALASKVKQ